MKKTNKKNIDIGDEKSVTRSEPNQWILSVVSLMEEIESNFSFYKNLAAYQKPLCSTNPYKLNYSEPIQSGFPLYSFISFCENNHNTLLISDFLNNRATLLLSLCTLSGIPLQNLIAGNISDADWPNLIMSAAQIHLWPGDTIKLPEKNESEEIVEQLVTLIKQDYEVYIFDFDTEVESKIFKNNTLRDQIFNLAQENKKRICLRRSF